MQQYADSIVLDYAGRVLLLHRANTDDFLPELWGVPGGKVEESDATLLHAAIRELMEETALVQGSDVDVTPDWISYQNENGSVSHYVVCSLTKMQPLIVLDMSEHQNYCWVPVYSLDEYNLIPGLADRIKSILSSERKTVDVETSDFISLPIALEKGFISQDDFNLIDGKVIKPFVRAGKLFSFQNHNLEKSFVSEVLLKSKKTKTVLKSFETSIGVLREVSFISRNKPELAG